MEEMGPINIYDIYADGCYPARARAGAQRLVRSLLWASSADDLMAHSGAMAAAEPRDRGDGDDAEELREFGFGAGKEEEAALPLVHGHSSGTHFVSSPQQTLVFQLFVGDESHQIAEGSPKRCSPGLQLR
jgi:hypothetical protein